MELVQIIKALADETRLRILNLLNQEKLCVCELEYLLEINQSNASRHLNKLWMLKIITNEKKAQWVFYKINKNTLETYPFLKQLLNKELGKDGQLQRDIDKLKEYKKSGMTCENVKEFMCIKNI
ncbi:ArsR/SmtB family transcription factor [Desulfitibacter alkalitolerans]|uniref:ArsR/SmtB family transcription factor n=1 Tax=Desulfitibacter alkalitolerans TaxID=264641 RepID=UPI000489A95E